ncbi:hypothetical protein CTheo_4936 [Ceratobasidium theobromae]|uniref:Uncharacterized protein n=1 Tax=Ceratobasidium theobromae TaxID=1582974 RepID=A0A5N5QJK2_9AGAM|nr:hypothetical protein CTheo_4936 [Ceratobasidium theobromae]
MQHNNAPTHEHDDATTHDATTRCEGAATQHTGALTQRPGPPQMAAPSLLHVPPCPLPPAMQLHNTNDQRDTSTVQQRDYATWHDGVYNSDALMRRCDGVTTQHDERRRYNATSQRRTSTATQQCVSCVGHCNCSRCAC